MIIWAIYSAEAWISALNPLLEILTLSIADGEKLLVKSEEEYTSPISKIYKVETDYIIVTENSIYLVSSDIPNKSSPVRC